MLVPAVIFFFVFNYLPMVGIPLAFRTFRYDLGVFRSPWVGLRNFEFFFMSGRAWLVTRNTILYNLLFITSNLIVQVSLAVFYSEMRMKYYKKISQSIIFLPYFISWVVVGVFAYNLLSYELGSINSLLRALNLETINVYSDPRAWPYILTSFNLWKFVGYGSVIYLAAITGIDRELYEAAAIDGANVFQRIRLITLPLIRPTIFILLLFSISSILRGNFDLFFQLVGNNGLLFNATDVIDTYVFRSLARSSDIGQAAAAGLYQQVFGFIVIITLNFIVRKVNSDYALF
jgi:putative aldouronate transport system permease protein